MDTASKIASQMGVPAIMTAMGVKERVIELHIERGKFPASWYRKLSEAAGEMLPLDAFNFH